MPVRRAALMPTDLEKVSVARGALAIESRRTRDRSREINLFTLASEGPSASY